jgi:hypothetical protein
MVRLDRLPLSELPVARSVDHPQATEPQMMLSHDPLIVESEGAPLRVTVLNLREESAEERQAQIDRPSPWKVDFEGQAPWCGTGN